MAKTAAVKVPKLKREALGVDAGQERLELAQKAQELLGYNELAISVGAGRLGEVLSSLKIKPYSLESVSAYKRAQASKVRAGERESAASWVRISATWKLVGLTKYKKPIPEFVLRKAVQIAEKMPEAEFFIDELTVVRSRRRSIANDPFLVVKNGFERYYIEVWSEPEFERGIIDEAHATDDDEL